MISIVIPALNAERTLADCLAGLKGQTAPPDSFEVIVADDGSTDRTRAVAQEHGARVVSQSHRGPGAARNLGAQHARGEVLLFLDADSVPDKNWVAAMVAPFADPTIMGVSGEKKTRQKSLVAQLVQLEYDFKYERIASHSSIDFVDSSTAGYRRETFLANGGFDTGLLEAEDTEFSFRLALRGCRMVLVRDAIVYHKHPVSLFEYWRRKHEYARWRVIVYERYPRKALSDTRTPQAQKLQMLLAAALLVTGGAVPFGQIFAWAFALVALVFFVTTIPLAAYCWKKAKWVALGVPLALLGTAYAGASGGVLGLLYSNRHPELRGEREL